MGLYDDEEQAATSGDQNSREYWEAKLASLALDEALKSRQPEGAIKHDLREKFLAAHDAALKSFPNHAGLTEWKAKAEAVLAKCNPAASGSYPPAFAPGNWDFRKFWVHLEWARHAKSIGDWQTVYEASMTAQSPHYNLGRTVDRFAEEWKRYCDEGIVEAKALRAEATTKR